MWFTLKLVGEFSGSATEFYLFILHFQINVPSLKGRFRHSATAISHTPTLVEVVLFGGCPEVPKDYRTHADLSQIGNTVVLRFGESTSSVS